MIPVKFPEQTVEVAKDQDEYLTLPAYQDEHETISCWELTDEELHQLMTTRRLWIRQMNFGFPLQPQLPQVENPFETDHG